MGLFVGAGVPPPTLTLTAAALLAVGSGSNGITLDVSLTQWGVSGLAETSGWSSQAYYFTGVMSHNSPFLALEGRVMAQPLDLPYLPLRSLPTS